MSTIFFKSIGSICWRASAVKQTGYSERGNRIKVFASPRAGKWKRLPGLNGQVLLFLCHSLFFHVGLLGIADILLNFYLVSIGMDAETIGVLQSLPRLSGFLIGLPIGWLANRVGNRRVIALSTAGIALSVAATAFTQALPLLALSRFCWGACFGANQVVKPPFMVTLTDRSEHTAQFSYHNLVSMLAVALGSALGGYLPLLVSGLLALDGGGGLRPERMPPAYQGGIIIAALIILLSALPVLALSGAASPADGSGEDSAAARRAHSFREVPWRALIRLAFPLFVFGISGGWTFPFFNLIFRDLFGISDSAIGGVIGLGWLLMGLMPLLNPVWERRWGRAGALTALMTASAAAFAGFSLAQALALAVGFYVAAIGLRNTMQPLFQPLLMNALPREYHNLASSIGLALWNIGWFAATLSYGWLYGALGHRGIMLLVAAFVLLNGLTVRLTARRGA